MSSFPDRLKKLRIKNGLTQEELGRKISVTKVSVSGYESGNRNPDMETLQKIADIFGISVDYLLGRTDDLTPNKELSTQTYDPELDEHAQEVYELFKDDPDSSSFWYEYKNADEETRKKMIDTWKIINELEKNRKPGDKQGK